MATGAGGAQERKQDEMNTAPYRQSAEMEVYVEPEAKRFGLIVVPKSPVEPLPPPLPPPPHKCNLPKPDVGFKRAWWQFYSKVMNREPTTLKRGDLWRCEECSRVFSFDDYWLPGRTPGRNNMFDPPLGCIHGCSSFCHFWVKATLTDWIENGGTE